jgi:hypothetical protein
MIARMRRQDACTLRGFIVFGTSTCYPDCLECPSVYNDLMPVRKEKPRRVCRVLI